MAGVKGKNPEGKEESITSEIKNRVLSVEMVDRDEISALAAEALGEFKRFEIQKEAFKSDKPFGCACIEGKLVCPGSEYHGQPC